MTFDAAGVAAETPEFGVVPVAPSLLGESPCWHPVEQVLYWCDIPGRTLHRHDPAAGEHQQWSFDCEPACCTPLLGGGVLLSMRDGLWRFDPVRGVRHSLAAAPYDPARERFNDGKADPQGRLWIGTIYEPRDAPAAGLYRFGGGQLVRMAGDITTSNGLAFSVDGRTLYWADTKAHVVRAFDFDGSDGSLSRPREFVRFAPRDPSTPLTAYAGRPDGAAVDSQGGYWVAMFEGQQLLRFTPDGRLSRRIVLPVRCPTMPCFGGADLRTLYLTTSRENRPADELARQPMAGAVLQWRVEVPGLPAHMARAG
jgi:sugar lactone lactonase YvrE